MSEINLEFQAVLFGAWEEVTPKPNNLTYLIESFADKELIPTTIQGLDNKGTFTGIGLKSSDEVWSIEIVRNRINVQKSNRDIGNMDIGDLDSFIKEVIKVSDIFQNKFPKKLNRIALVTNYLTEEFGPKELQSICNKLINSIDIYKTNEVHELNTRVVTRLEKKIQDKTELLNVISELRKVAKYTRIKSKLHESERIILKLDINTFQENTDYRFGPEDISSFYDEARRLESNLLKSHLELIKTK